MNGNRIVKGGTKTIHDAHYAIKPQVLSTLADHSKCLIFVDSNSVKNTTNILNNNLQIKAMILGSSNISCSTYVDSPTVKGELDIMLINENYYSKANVLYFKNNLTETSLIDGNKTEGDINYMVSQSVEFGKEQDNNVLNKYMLSIIENDK